PLAARRSPALLRRFAEDHAGDPGQDCGQDGPDRPTLLGGHPVPGKNNKTGSEESADDEVDDQVGQDILDQEGKELPPDPEVLLFGSLEVKIADRRVGEPIGGLPARGHDSNTSITGASGLAILQHRHGRPVSSMPGAGGPAASVRYLTLLIVTPGQSSVRNGV